MTVKSLKSPSVASGVIICNSEGKIFLAKSHKWGGNWIVPGGHLEYGETFEENVKRECKEETGMDVTDVKLIQTQESIFPDNFKEEKHFVFINFMARAEDIDSIELNDELDEYNWFDPRDALEELSLNNSTREFIEEYIRLLS